MKVTTLVDGRLVVEERPDVPHPADPADPPRRVDIEGRVADLAAGLSEVRDLAAVRRAASDVADRLNR